MDPVSKKHLDIKVSGRVQGVFFRVSAKHEAHKLGLTGFAKNCEDNSVCIEAEGDEPSLRKFLDWCARGPIFAHVLTIQSEFGDDLKNFDSFETI